MPTTWKTGATRNARNAVKVTKPPRVSAPAKISRAPTYITTAPTTPMNRVADRLMPAITVSDWSTLSSSRRTPRAKTASSRASA